MTIPLVPVALCRATIGQATGVDITVKSAIGEARVFAPRWEMVRGHQNHTLSNAEYTAQYLELLERVPIAAWRWLTAQRQQGILTLLCYCAPYNHDGGRKFCHTHLCIDAMLRRWPQYFRDAREK